MGLDRLDAGGQLTNNPGFGRCVAPASGLFLPKANRITITSFFRQLKITDWKRSLDVSAGGCSSFCLSLSLAVFLSLSLSLSVFLSLSLSLSRSLFFCLSLSRSLPLSPLFKFHPLCLFLTVPT